VKARNRTSIHGRVQIFSPSLYYTDSEACPMGRRDFFIGSKAIGECRQPLTSTFERLRNTAISAGTRNVVTKAYRLIWKIPGQYLSSVNRCFLPQSE
jgi:hypothetical protein